MDRMTWAVARGYMPAAFALAVAVVSMFVVAGLQSSPYLAGLVPLARWVPLAALAAAMGLWAVRTWGLWRWQQGAAAGCCVCGGPLGFERVGRTDRGGAYRRCLACRTNVNHRHYE
ncbi:hypothetical protein GCM10025793_16810 [Lysobacter lycopersici]